MGLLSKAGVNENEPPVKNPEKGLDEMGKALRDRLLSLSETKPETAISLLKAYGSFKAGVCLSLDGDLYRSYAAVGTGNSVELSPDLLRKIPNGNRYSVDYRPGVSGGIRDSAENRSFPSGTKFWAFSLDENDEEPPFRILLVEEDKNYFFPGEAVESLVQAAKSAFVPSTETRQIRETRQTRDEVTAEIAPGDDVPPAAAPPEQLPAKKTGGGLLALAKKHSSKTAPAADFSGIGPGTDSRASSAADDSGEKKILLFLSAVMEKNGSIHGLVFESDGQAEGFAARIKNMVSGFADTVELGAGRCLIIGGQSLDCELLSHKLSASVPGKELARFSAENPGEAMSILEAYL